MANQTKFSPEVRERAVRMVQESRDEHSSLWSAVGSMAPKIGCTPTTLLSWVQRAEIDSGQRAEVSRGSVAPRQPRPRRGVGRACPARAVRPAAQPRWPRRCPGRFIYANCKLLQPFGLQERTVQLGCPVLRGGLQQLTQRPLGQPELVRGLKIQGALHGRGADAWIRSAS